MKKQIYIIGTGAIGKALAVFLSKAGKDVLLLRGSVEDQELIQKTIRVQSSSGELLEASIDVSSCASLPAFDGLVIVATKSFGNGRLVGLIQNKIGRSPLVILQNGLGVEQPFIEAGFSNVYRCVLFVTSQIMDDHIRFKSVTTCPIGIIKGPAETLEAIVADLDTPQFGFKSEKDIHPVIWRKAIVNSVFNSVCPLLDADNGIFYRNKQALDIAKNIISECLEVAKASGVSLAMEEVSDSLLQISRQSDGQIISTLQDIRHGRPTEIDTLNLEIARIADLHNLSVPKTKLLGELTVIRSALTLNS